MTGVATPQDMTAPQDRADDEGSPASASTMPGSTTSGSAPSGPSATVRSSAPPCPVHQAPVGAAVPTGEARAGSTAPTGSGGGASALPSDPAGTPAERLRRRLGDARRSATVMVNSLRPHRSDWRTGLRDPRADLVAGATVAMVALPHGLAFGASSGLGAGAGLATAVVAGIVAAVFGGSNLQVSGPTGAMTVVLVPIVHRYGAHGVMMVGALAGLMLLVMSAAKVGRYVRYLPVSLVEGFTAGIAVVIGLQQVPQALGVTGAKGDKVWQSALDAVGLFIAHPHLAAPLTALVVAAVILLAARYAPAFPVALVAVAGAGIVTHVAHLPLTLLGTLPRGLSAPSLGFVDLAAVPGLLPSAAAVAALAALESLLCASVADAMSVDEHHDPDRELFGQGLANLAAPLFGGIPATAAIARTAVNVRAGARSRIAAVVHALLLLAMVALAAPLVGGIPVAALAGVLIATAVRMVEVSSLWALARATRADALVLVATLVVTVAVDLVTAVAVGVTIAAVWGLRAVARAAHVEQVPLDRGRHTAAEHALLSEHIVVYRLDGPLFFAAAHTFLLELSRVTAVQVVILRMSRVTAIDATGAQVLADAIERLEARGVTVLVSGISTGHDAVLAHLGVADHLREAGRVFAHTPEAIACARTLVHRGSPALAATRAGH